METIILDIREHDEIKKERIEDSLNIPMSTIEVS
jgi:rhodanese-related sulfurtransferase